MESTNLKDDKLLMQNSLIIHDDISVLISCQTES